MKPEPVKPAPLPVEPPKAAAPPPEAPMPVVAIALVTGGAVVALGGSIGALVFNEQLGTPEDFQARSGKELGGQLCLVAAVAGIGAGVAGAVMLTMQ